MKFDETGATVYYLPDTTGWDDPFTQRPTVLWNPILKVNEPGLGMRPGGFKINIAGTTNIPVLVEASAELWNPVWVPLQTNSLTEGTWSFLDPFWTNYSSRFYRIRSP